MSEMTDPQALEWVDRKLALYTENVEPHLHRRVMGSMHVVCFRYQQVEFYGSEFSRITRDRDNLKIALGQTQDKLNRFYSETAQGETGVRLIAQERQRQIVKERFVADHDDDHDDGSLAFVAARYALQDARIDGIDSLQTVREELSDLWPWDADDWKPKTPLRNLIRAGALIAAEIDRRVRAGEELDGSTTMPAEKSELNAGASATKSIQ